MKSKAQYQKENDELKARISQLHDSFREILVAKREVTNGDYTPLFTLIEDLWLFENASIDVAQ